MSSTVTTATVAAITTATMDGGLGHALPLIALMVLAVGLFARDLILASRNQRAKRLLRGLDIGNAPLAIGFVLIATINAALTLHAL